MQQELRSCTSCAIAGLDVRSLVTLNIVGLAVSLCLCVKDGTSARPFLFVHLLLAMYVQSSMLQ